MRSSYFLDETKLTLLSELDEKRAKAGGGRYPTMGKEEGEKINQKKSSSKKFVSSKKTEASREN